VTCIACYKVNDVVDAMVKVRSIATLLWTGITLKISIKIKFQ